MSTRLVSQSKASVFTNSNIFFGNVGLGGSAEIKRILSGGLVLTMALTQWRISTHQVMTRVANAMQCNVCPSVTGNPRVITDGTYLV